MIELLIGLFVGLIVVAGMLRFLWSLSNYSTKTLKTVRLDYELQSAMNIMTNDIRRAGYWANSANMIATGANTNPFMASGTDLSTPSSSCILFTYDYDKNGSLPAINTGTNDERFGFRLSNGAIQARANVDSSFDCSAGTWENITNPDLMTVSSLTYTLTPTTVYLTSPVTTEAIVIRYVNIVIVAYLKDDTTITTQLSANIRVRNDKYQP